ncbi:hypothetical protein BpHYR1_032631 [Brachionus plicatilis]|uniref:Uncharacterized protein n=1 Tax=Brachionus plicatilis TaxID=10195 RepID=A0A3M7PCS4_BRAPC|nr:hypothetical protein BpHYR1_032631 [Brachionus plicatilis]
MLSKLHSISSICSSVMFKPSDFSPLAKYNQRKRHVLIRLNLLNNSTISLVAFREPNGDSFGSDSFKINLANLTGKNNCEKK